MKISLESLMQSLVSRGAEAARSSPIDESTSPTSIRLKPNTKHFLEYQAKALNTSTQSLISMILDGVAEVTMDKTSGTLRTIKERFFYLFQVHGIDLPGTVSIMKQYGFTLSVLDTPSRLLDLINQESIHYLAQTFFIQPKWISGASDYASENNIDVSWYKNVHAAGRKLIKYSEMNLNPHVMFIRRERANFDKAFINGDTGYSNSEPVGLVVRLSHTTDDGVYFNTYEVWEFQRWNYWRCREQLKLLIAFCDQARHLISFAGYEIPNEEVDLLRAGKIVAAAIMKKSLQIRWYPDDYASIRTKVTQETSEWAAIRQKYVDEKYDEIIIKSMS